MKQIAFNILFLVYSCISIGILVWAILFPFGIGMKDFPTGTGWAVYPLAIIITATHYKITTFLTKNYEKNRNP